MTVAPDFKPIEKAPETAAKASKAKDALENFLGIGLVIVGIILAVKFLGADQMRAWVESAGPWAPLAVVLAKATTIVVAPLSGGPVYLVAGALFGTWRAVLYLFLGDVLGGSIAFFIARRFGRKLVERILKSQNAEFLDRALELMGTVKGFFVARICFIALPEAVAYGAGLTKLGFLPFVTIYGLLALPSIVPLAFAGDAALGEHGGSIATLGIVGGSVAAAAGVAIFMKLAGKSPETPKKDE
jgi:uncharacterized membrane protein YdjX (TVP38/TMEM64 family)